MNMNPTNSPLPPHRRFARRLAFLALALALAPALGWAQNPEGDVRATLSMEPERVYAGQTFTLTLTIRAHGVTLGRQFNLDGLPDSGILELDAFQELPARREEVNAVLVDVRQFRCRAYARQAGSLELAPTLQYERLSQERTWFGVTTFQSPRRLALVPLTLRVHPLPEAHRPADFSGAVGQFTFTVEATPREVAPGDLVTLTLAVRGDGRLDAVTCPPLIDQAGFRVYPPRLLAGDKAGERRFEQIVIPESTNAVTTPTARFVYFDPLAGTYRTLTAGSIPLNLHARSAAPSFVPYRPNTPPVGATNGMESPEGLTSAGMPTSGPRSATWWRASGTSAAPMLIRALSVLSLLAGVVSMGAAGLRRRRRRPIVGAWPRRAALLVAGLLGLGIAHALEHRVQSRLADHSLTHTVTLRLAPSSGALALGELPPGTAVQVTETWSLWRKISSGDQRGWVPASAVNGGATP